MPDAYSKSLEVSEVVSSSNGYYGPYDLEPDDPADMCIYAVVLETQGVSGAYNQPEQLWTEWYPGGIRCWVMFWGEVVEEEFSFTIHAVFQPVTPPPVEE